MNQRTITSNKAKPSWPSTEQDYPEVAVITELRDTTGEPVYKIVVQYLRQDGTRYKVHNRWRGYLCWDSEQSHYRYTENNMITAVRRAKILLGMTRAGGKTDYVPDTEDDGLHSAREAVLTPKEARMLAMYRGE